jgi:cytochrome c oxidase subunit 2
MVMGTAPRRDSRGSRSRNTTAMLLLGLVALALAFTLSAFWPSTQTSGPRVVEPTAMPTAADPRINQGRTLATTFGCTSCHSTDGARGVGPTWRGLYGSQVQLDDGTSVTADDRFLTDKIQHPDQLTVSGFAKGMMGPSIQPYAPRLAQAETVNALIAYIQSLQ